MENKFFVGQKVWSSIYGHGVVVLLSGFSTHPVVAKFNIDNDKRHHNNDGYLAHSDPKHAAPTLFPADEIPEFYKQYAQDPRIGKWGYFWDAHMKGAHYSKLEDITTDGRFRSICGGGWINFSLEIPEHCK